MKLKELKEEIIIPDNIRVKLDSHIHISGPQGEIKRLFNNPKIKINQENGKLLLYSKNTSKREKMHIQTIKSHIKNMFSGVTQGFTYKLKICSSHFPISVNVKDDIVEIKNFFGERKQRKAKILPGVKVNVDGLIISVTGYNKESVSQTSANIEQATRITKRDKRRFQDGIRLIERNGALIV